MDETDLLRALVEAYSPSGKEAEAVRRFTDIASSLGFSVHVDEAGNGIARRGSGTPQVLFLGHIDTVDGELPVRVADGRIYGRGTCDAKGALIAALLAGRSHAGPGEIVVVAAVGEELDSRGVRFVIPRFRPDFLIVGEPSGWSGVTIGYKGNLSLVVTFTGERTHLSSPSPTTVEVALSFISRLREFCEEHTGPTTFSSLTAKVHAIHTRRSGGGEVVDVHVNLRSPPGVQSEQVVKFIQDTNLASEIRVVDRSEAIEGGRNETVRAISNGIRREGGSPKLLRKLGTSDMNLVTPAWGCPAAAYGPGDGHLGHTDKESLAIEDLEKSIRVLEAAFASLVGRKSTATPAQLGTPAMSQ